MAVQRIAIHIEVFPDDTGISSIVNDAVSHAGENGWRLRATEHVPGMVVLRFERDTEAACVTERFDCVDGVIVQTTPTSDSADGTPSLTG